MIGSEMGAVQDDVAVLIGDMRELRDRMEVVEDRLDEHVETLTEHDRTLTDLAGRLGSLETISDELADTDPAAAHLRKVYGRLGRGEHHGGHGWASGDAVPPGAAMGDEQAPGIVVDSEVHCSCCEQGQRDAHAAIANWRGAEDALDDMTRQRDSARAWVEEWRAEADKRLAEGTAAITRAEAAEEHAREARDWDRQARAERDEARGHAERAWRESREARAERDEWKTKYGANSPTAVAYEQACASLDKQEARAEQAEAERDARVALPDGWREQLGCAVDTESAAWHVVGLIESWRGGGDDDQ
jgi:hypothetical protein